MIPTLITDDDILRFAKAQIERHGEGASRYAAQQAAAMIEKGNSRGARVWQRILAAIGRLQATERQE